MCFEKFDERTTTWTAADDELRKTESDRLDAERATDETQEAREEGVEHV